MKLILIICAFFVFFSSAHVSAQNPDYQKIINEFGDQLAKDVSDDNVGSISATIILNNQLICSNAFGYADPVQKIHADTSTIYRIASASKPFTVLLMMQMFEAGYFRLDDPVEDFVPEIKLLKGYSDSTKITFKQLASHTSGLEKEPGLRKADLGPINEWKERLEMAIPTTEFISKPGMAFNYSNVGMSILGLAIS